MESNDENGINQDIISSSQQQQHVSDSSIEYASSNEQLSHAHFEEGTDTSQQTYPYNLESLDNTSEQAYDLEESKNTFDHTSERDTPSSEEHIRSLEHTYASSEYHQYADGKQFEVGSESGVEPDYNEWIFEEGETEKDILMDLTTEQAMATLRYFTSTADRANMMTKTHSDDLDLISQLLNDKEKDLEMAAKIGQSLLQRNKQLLMKIEKMEDYLSETKDTENQLKFDLQHKNEIVRQYMQFDESNNSYSSQGSRDYACEDEELLQLTKRCRTLEKENQDLFSEALTLREVTEEVEDQEEDLVLDCINQLSSAKHQITALTDEIAQKFEDNVQQQEEITQLITLVVELQKRQKQLNSENELLQSQLYMANENQETLQEQLSDMQKKFRETYEMLQENQEEMKSLKSRIDHGPSSASWTGDVSNSAPGLQDSLATEIEESVRRDLLYTHEQRRRNKKVLDNVRFLNIKAGDSYSRSTSGRTSPISNWSFASDERSDTASTFSVDTDSVSVRSKKPAKKLQIVKPLEGSDTLNKWHHLASQNVTGGLTINEGEQSPEQKKLNLSLEDDTDTVIDSHNVPPTISLPDPISETTTDEEILSPQVRKTPRVIKQSTPNAKKITSMFADLDTAQKRRTIITRNSSVLSSIRQGRKLLNEEDKAGKSKTEVIDMIANAMSKVNVEAKTGKRILDSLAANKKIKKPVVSPKTEYKDMPHVSRVLEKAAQSKHDEAVKEEEAIEIAQQKGKEETKKDEKLFIESKILKNEIDVLESPVNANLPKNENKPKLTSIVNKLSLDLDDSLSDPDESDMNNVGGPLGLLNRANPTESNNEIMSRLLRLSGQGINNVQATKQDNDSLGIRRNQSGGSLVDMMMLNKRGTRGPMGVAHLVSPSSSISFDNTLNPLQSTNNEGVKPSTSKSAESGLDIKPSTNNGDSGLYGGFMSFLGKFS